MNTGNSPAVGDGPAPAPDGSDPGAVGLDQAAAGPESPAYADAMAELEQILADLEGEDPDVDVLSGQVKRAAFLIDVCRRRITAARLSVEQVIASLDRDDD